MTKCGRRRDLAFGDSVGKSTIQPFVILAVVLAGITYRRRSGRPRRR